MGCLEHVINFLWVSPLAVFTFLRALPDSSDLVRLPPVSNSSAETGAPTLCSSNSCLYQALLRVCALSPSRVPAVWQAGGAVRL